MFWYMPGGKRMTDFQLDLSMDLTDGFYYKITYYLNIDTFELFGHVSEIHKQLDRWFLDGN